MTGKPLVILYVHPFISIRCFLSFLKFLLKLVSEYDQEIPQSQTADITKSPLVQVFILSVIQFDKSVHPVVLSENYLIGKFMSTYENLKMKEKKH